MSNIHRSFSIYRLIGVLGFTAMVIFLAVMGGGAGFVHAPGIFIIFLSTFMLLLATFGHDYLKFLPDSFLTLFCIPVTPIPRYADICRFGSRYAIASSLITVFISYIGMLRHIDDPSSIGAGFSLIITPILYALILSEVVFVYLHKSYSDGEESNHPTPPIPMSILSILVYGAGALLLSFVTLYYAFIH